MFHRLKFEGRRWGLPNLHFFFCLVWIWHYSDRILADQEFYLPIRGYTETSVSAKSSFNYNLPGMGTGLTDETTLSQRMYSDHMPQEGWHWIGGWIVLSPFPRERCQAPNNFGLDKRISMMTFTQRNQQAALVRDLLSPNKLQVSHYLKKRSLFAWLGSCLLNLD